jgi:hypothetical protein
MLHSLYVTVTFALHSGQGLVAGGPPRIAKPFSAMRNAKDVLRFRRLPNNTITVTDVQNNTAHVADQPIMLPRANIFPVDRVLLNGESLAVRCRSDLESCTRTLYHSA